MLTILNLFGKSPFAPLQTHMVKVAQCVHLLPALFEALSKEDWEKVEEIAAKISEAEHEADLTKNDIRNHLPKSLYLAVDRSSLLEILSLQDNIADRAEDVAVLSTLKHLSGFDLLQEEFVPFLKMNVSAFDQTHRIIKELHELIESSFGGIEAEKVRILVEKVSVLEHEIDIMQRNLLKKLFKVEDLMTFSTFLLWQKIFAAISDISNLSEKLSYRVRMTLELK